MKTTALPSLVVVASAFSLSASSASVSAPDLHRAEDNKKDKEYGIYRGDDDDGDDKLKDENNRQGHKGGGADKKEKHSMVESVMQLAQFDSTSSRRSKAIDSERVPIEYNSSEVAASF
ncbi:hypothetical protein BGZ47_009392 [Haplosporangium gracile]|nr:hypothetical protein BGZ47_009392 [Haplosporangium gracile]